MQVIDGIVSIIDKFALNNSSSHSVLDFLCKSSHRDTKVDPNPLAHDVKKVGSEELCHKAPVDAIKDIVSCLIDTVDPCIFICLSFFCLVHWGFSLFFWTFLLNIIYLLIDFSGMPDCMITKVVEGTSLMTCYSLSYLFIFHRLFCLAKAAFILYFDYSLLVSLIFLSNQPLHSMRSER